MVSDLSDWTSDPESLDGAPSEDLAIRRILGCRINELTAYQVYLEGLSPYSTQHGVKGAEFPQVIVVLDDEEGHYSLYSYEKLLGLRELSNQDRQNVDEGRESVLDRTRRLFYVSCSRAREHLAVALFTSDYMHAADQLRTSGLFPADCVSVFDGIDE